MADVGEAWQNGYAERLIRTTKEGCICCLGHNAPCEGHAASTHAPKRSFLAGNTLLHKDLPPGANAPTKEEQVDLSEYIDYNDAYRQLGYFLDDVYMRKRIHSLLGYLTPAEFEDQWQKEQALDLDLN